MKYFIPVTWAMYGEYMVKADSLEMAIKMVENAESPYDELPYGEYIDGSFEINKDMIEEVNENVF